MKQPSHPSRGFLPFATARMGHLKSILATLLLAATALATRAQVITPPSEMVYQNTAVISQQPTAFYARGELGDEIRLAGGEARKITGFAFLYYGDFSGSGVTATLRLYKNDGPDADPGDHLVPAPGTLLYESDPIALLAGYHDGIVNGLAIDVPSGLTWTVEFSGVSQTAGNRAGLVFADPPTLGSGFDDYWEKRGGVWGGYTLGGSPVANFDARIQAYSFPLSIESIGNVSVQKNTTSGDLTIKVISVVGDPGVLTVTASADNKTLVPDTGIVITGSPTSLTRTMTITPAANQSGVATVNLLATSVAGLTAKSSFVLRVTDSANPVQLTPIADQNLLSGQASENLPFQVFGLSEAGGLTGSSFTSDNQSLLPDFRIVRDVVDFAAGKFFVRVEPVQGKTGVANVTIQINSGSGAKGSTKFKVTVGGGTANLPTVSVAASQPNAAEPATPGEFTITRTGDTSASLLVSYSVAGSATAGTDYSALTGSAVIPATALSVKVPVTVVNDNLTEESETVVIILTPKATYTTGGSGAATVTIADDDAVRLPVVSITAVEPNVSEGGGTGHFKVSRTGETTAALAVNYSVSGSVIAGTDYAALGGSIVLPIGAATADLPVSVLDDTTLENDETLVLTLTANAAYTVGSPASATITIVDNDAPATGPRITKQPVDVITSPGAASFTVEASGTAPLTYKWSLNGEPLTDGGAFQGATTAKLLVTVGGINQSGDYQVEVSNPVGKDTSRVAKLVVQGTGGQPPEISSIANQTTDQDRPLTVSFLAVDPEGATLILKGRSDKPELLDGTGFVFSTMDGFSFTAVITPKAGQGGEATAAITVSDGFNLSSALFKLTVSGPANTPPTISDIGNQTLAFRAVTGLIPFTVGDAETAPDALTVTARSSNQTLAPDALVVLGGSGANRTLKVSPMAGHSGTATITVTVKDAGNATKTDTFILTVGPNSGPTISNIADRTVVNSIPETPAAFTVGDAETPAADLILTAASSAPAIIPATSVVFGGSGANRTVKVTPVAATTGQVTITVTVSDWDGGRASDSYVVNVVAPPVTTPNERFVNHLHLDTTGALPSTGDFNYYVNRLGSGALSQSDVANGVVGDVGARHFAVHRAFRSLLLRPADAGALSTFTSFLAGSDERALLGAILGSAEYFGTRADNNNERWIEAVYGDVLGRQPDGGGQAAFLGLLGGGATRSVVAGMIVNSAEATQKFVQDLYQDLLRRDADAAGLSMIASQLQNGLTLQRARAMLLSSPEYFNQTEAARANRAPVANNATITVSSGSSVKILLRGTDKDGDLLNSTLVNLPPAAAGVISGATPLVTFTPAPGFVGDTSFTFHVDDGEETSADATVAITVTGANTPPTISAITDQVTNEDTALGPLAFTIGDAQTPAAALLLSAESSNHILVPLAGIDLGGSGADGTITVTPAANQSGVATITLVVTDGDGASTTREFQITVTPVNDAPQISFIAEQSTTEGVATDDINFMVRDVDNNPNSFTLTGSADSTNPLLIPAGGITFGGTVAVRTVKVTPAAGQSGKAVITVNANDGAATGKTTFLLTVNPNFPEITQPPLPQAAKAGGTATFEVAATGSRLDYRWRKGNTYLVDGPNISGASTAKLTLLNVAFADAGDYLVEVRNPAGSALGGPVSLRVLTSPAILVDPVSQTVPVGFTPTLVAVAIGSSPLTYEWFKQGQAAPVGEGSSLLLPSVTTASTGDYFAVASNPVGAVTSQVARISVLLAPFITAHPQGATLAVGGSATLDVTVEGEGPFTYRWRKNGVNLPLGTNQSLVLGNVQIADGGSYEVAVQGPHGAITSRPALIKLTLPELALSDAFASRTVLSPATNGSGGLDLPVATLEAGEPAHGDSTANSSSGWIKWVAPRSGQLTLDTKGSSYDTILDVYTGATLASLVLVATDDDSGGFRNSQARFQVTSGAEYQIAVTGRNGAAGRLVLNWLFEAENRLPVITRQPVSVNAANFAPVNFSIEASGPADAGPVTVVWTLTDTIGSREAGTGFQISVQAIPATLIARVSNNEGFVDSVPVTVTTTVVFTPLIPTFSSIYSSNFNQLPIIGSLFGNTGNLFGVISNIVGGVFKVSYSGQNGRPDKAGIAPGINQGGGQEAEKSFGATLATTTTGATSAPGEPAHCGVVGGASRWFTYRPPAEGVLTIDTDGSSFDTVIAVYTGNPLNFATLVPVACDNNSGTNGLASKVTLNVKAGTEYYVAMDGVNGATGLLVVTYRLSAPLAISAIPDQTITGGQPSAPISFDVVSTATASSNLLVIATSSNQELLPDNGLGLSSNGTNLSLVITPGTKRAGTATVTITATDLVAVSQRSFAVTLTAGNSVPEISGLNDVTVSPGLGLTLRFSVADAETAASNLVVTASSSNTGVLAANDLTLGGSGAARSLRLSAPRATGSTVITLTVKDAAGATATSSFSVTSEAQAGPPVITTGPASQSIVFGGTVTFTVTAAGTEPLGYQWHFNGRSIPGATNASLTLPNVQDLGAAGDYSVTVSNAAGSTSAAAQLNVLLPPVPDPVLTGTLVDGEFQLLMENLPSGASYSLQASENLLDWVELTTFNGDFGIAGYTDEVPSEATKRFYRIMVLNPR